MFSFAQIFLCFAVLNSATCFPFFGEFRFKQHFEVEHKPPPPPPIFKHHEFIKEIVTPFGKYGVKHSIGKRDLDNIKTVEDKPEKVPLLPPETPEDRYEVEEPRGEPMPTPVPPMAGQVTPGMGPLIEGGPVPPQMPPHFVEMKPIPAPPHPPVVITPPPPKVDQVRPTGLHTDIAREEAINEYLKMVEREQVIPLGNHIEQTREEPKVEELPKVEEPPRAEEPPPNLLVRGSRLAIYFGNVLIDVLSQILGGGRFAELINRPITI